MAFFRLHVFTSFIRAALKSNTKSRLARRSRRETCTRPALVCSSPPPGLYEYIARTSAIVYAYMCLNYLVVSVTFVVDAKKFIGFVC